MRIVMLVACLWLATSPLHGKIVFHSNRDGNREIYTMNSDGSNQTRLTFHNADDVLPTWSPDGNQIAFASYRADHEKKEIYVMDADGSNQRRLTHHPGSDSYPDWSPDGNQIAFTSNRNADEKHRLNIFVMDADGGNIRQVTNTFFAQRPRWSPNGKWILFMEGEIFAIRPDGTDLWQVSEPRPGKTMALGGWSPDGKQIIYTEAIDFSVNTTTPVIATLHLADPQRVFKWVRLKRPLKALSSFSFSADGKSILFRGRKDFVKAGVEGNPWNIYRFGLVDKKLIQLTDNPDRIGAPREWNSRLPVSPRGLAPTRWGEIKSNSHSRRGNGRRSIPPIP